MRIFISYSRVDTKACEDIARYLRRIYTYDAVWFDSELRGGEQWWLAILGQIQRCDIFMYLLSKESIASQYCQGEFQEALRLRKKILPAVVRDKTDVPSWLNKYHYINLSQGITLDGLAELAASIEGMDKQPMPTWGTSPSRPSVGTTPLPGPKSRRFPWIVGAMILTILILACGTAVVLGAMVASNGDSNSTSEDEVSPSTTITETVTNTREGDPSPSATNIGNAECSRLASRLNSGSQGYVTPGVANNIRSQPSLSGEVQGQIPAGGVFTVLSGPQCGDRITWWNVSYNGTVGWTGESGSGSYWIAPYSPQEPTPVPSVPVPTNIPSPTRSINPTPALPADLVISSVGHSPSNPSTTDTITFTVRVLNQGTGPSSATAINVKIGGDTIGQNHSIPLLQAGQTATVNFQDNLDVAQNYLVNVTVDPGNVVAESSEGNNSVSHSFTVSP